MAASLHRENTSLAVYLSGLPAQIIYGGLLTAPVLIVGVNLDRRRHFRDLKYTPNGLVSNNLALPRARFHQAAVSTNRWGRNESVSLPDRMWENADTEATAPGAALKTDPGIVWHYTDGFGLLSILRHNALWATSAAFLNDKSEVALGGRRMAQRISQLAESSRSPFLARLAADFWNVSTRGREPSPSQFFILSASQSWDSLAMWRLYGGAQESYAIGLDAGRPLSVLAAPESYEPEPHPPTEMSLEQQRGRIYLKRRPWEPVRYTAPAQQELVDAALDDLPEHVEAVLSAVEHRLDARPLRDLETLPAAAQKIILDVLDELDQALLLIKHEGFVEERETRASFVLWERYDDEATARLTARLVRYRSTSYGITPYLELTGCPDGDPAGTDGVLTETRRPLPIRAVAISPSLNGPAAAMSLAQVLRAHGYGGVPVLKSAIPFRG
jgi:hypothetical protein